VAAPIEARHDLRLRAEQPDVRVVDEGAGRSPVRVRAGDNSTTATDTLGSMAESDSEDLILRAKSGDAKAVEALIRRHIGGLRIFVRARMDPVLRAQESSSDLVQSVCHDVIEKLHMYECQGEGSFRNWLFTMALNKLHDHERFHSAQKRDVAREEHASMDRLQPEDLARAYQALTSPTQHAIHEELVTVIEATLDQMPANYREVILLSRIVGLNHDEIAQQMDTTTGNVRVLLHRALARLATDLHLGAGETESDSEPESGNKPETG
jgi:RNA polymerase sigma-70 factor, ECF subfamily